MTKGTAMRRWEIMGRLADERVLAIIRADDAGSAVEVGAKILAAGLGVVEVSFTTPGATDAIASLAVDHPDRMIGAGTVLDAAAAFLAIRAGARFLVSPRLDPAVVGVAHRHGIAVIPGCGTATEMMTALEAGADAVKLFPATTWTVGGLRDLLAALPQLPCVPTGGIGIDDATSWLDAGAVAVGLGSSLTGGGIDEVARRAERLVKLLSSR